MEKVFFFVCWCKSFHERKKKRSIEIQFTVTARKKGKRQEEEEKNISRWKSQFLMLQTNYQCAYPSRRLLKLFNQNVSRPYSCISIKTFPTY